MRSEISELAGGNEWRLFTSTFYENHITYGVSDRDYSILCNLIEQILKNLFKFDCTISDILLNQTVQCRSDIRSSFYENKYCMHVNIKTELFFIEFTFKFTKVDEFFIFDTCVFSIDDEYLLNKLPVGINAENISCVSEFTLNQAYFMTTVLYKQLIRHYDNGKLLENDCPTLLYEFDIMPASINLDVKYYYSDNTYSDGYSRTPTKYFLNRYSNITSDMELKISQFYTLIRLYSSQINVKDIFPHMDKSVLTSAIHTKSLLDDFLYSNENISDDLLVFDMAMI